jgi:hypothetical protein
MMANMGRPSRTHDRGWEIKRNSDECIFSLTFQGQVSTLKGEAFGWLNPTPLS